MTPPVLYPIDRASFKGIREEGFLYVDKTGYIEALLKSKGKYFFLARPRRFGKSLFLDTLAQFFLGNRDLFKDLYIDSLQDLEWNSYPVLRFNLTGTSFFDKGDLVSLLKSQLDILETEYGVVKSDNNINNRLYELILNLYKKEGKPVVVLIDEYDAPLSSTIDRTELRDYYREQLHGFFSILKKAEEYIQFCMLTGVTRYGKVSVFSGLNNINDISFDNEFAGICGITTDELKKYYEVGIENLAKTEGITTDKAFQVLKHYYDGYHFTESMLDIYNPYSINYALKNGRIRDYWCQSGLPTVLSKSLIKNDFDISLLNGAKVDHDDLTDLSLHIKNPIPLFYQTGYLTIKSYDARNELFTLGYPNLEVETGTLKYILKDYSEAKTGKVLIVNMENALRQGNPNEFVEILKSFLSDIPLDLRKDVKKYENYYHTIFYCLIKLIGLDISAEYATSEGYIDILIKTEDYIYVIELKVNGTAENAIKQIEEKHYTSPFKSDHRKIYEIGIGFSKDSGTITSTIIK